MVQLVASENMELELLLTAIQKAYGYDFMHYTKASLKRRLNSFMQKNNFENFSQMQEKILANQLLFQDLLVEISVTVTEMFRDPEFYLAFRKQVVPILKTYPFIKIWHAGCASGEEVYSMAIVLYEEGFLSKTHIHATDFNSLALEKAKTGIYKAQSVKQYINNYNMAGGKAAFSDYYHANYGAVKLRDFLKQHITFSNHNLVTDQIFGEMNVILCRNVLIYFDRELQDDVLKKLKDSLCHRGFLCLGTKESLNYTSVENEFEKFYAKGKIFRKRK